MLGGSHLALRELWRLAGALQTGLLPLLGPRIAGQQAGLAEGLGVLLVDLQQRPRDAVGDRADLAGDPATLDLDHRVELADGVGDAERGRGALHQTVAAEVLVEWLAVDDDGALTGDQAHPRDRRLPAAGALEIRKALHRVASFRACGFWAACG